MKKCRDKFRRRKLLLDNINKRGNSSGRKTTRESKCWTKVKKGSYEAIKRKAKRRKLFAII